MRGAKVKLLNNDEIIQRLYEQPDKFMKAMSRKEYANAAFTAYIAECVCLFCGVPRSIRTELFGDRQADPPIEGLFPEHLVIKANDQMVFQHKTLQELTLKEKREREEAWELCQKTFRKGSM